MTIFRAYDNDSNEWLIEADTFEIRNGSAAFYLLKPRRLLGGWTKIPAGYVWAIKDVVNVSQEGQ